MISDRENRALVHAIGEWFQAREGAAEIDFLKAMRDTAILHVQQRPATKRRRCAYCGRAYRLNRSITGVRAPVVSPFLKDVSVEALKCRAEILATWAAQGELLCDRPDCVAMIEHYCPSVTTGPRAGIYRTS